MRGIYTTSNFDDCGRMTNRTMMSNPGNFPAFAGLIKTNRARPLNPQQLPLPIAPQSTLRDDEYWPSRLFSILSLLSTFRWFRLDAHNLWCIHHGCFLTLWRPSLPPVRRFTSIGPSCGNQNRHEVLRGPADKLGQTCAIVLVCVLNETGRDFGESTRHNDRNNLSVAVNGVPTATLTGQD